MISAYPLKGSSGTVMDDLRRKASKLEKYKYPLIVLVIGVLLMLLPTGTAKQTESGGRDELMAGILASSEGVGSARVLISDNGVVVACGGAEDAKVRLNVIRAVSSYTGFGSDKITILKLTELSKGEERG